MKRKIQFKKHYMSKPNFLFIIIKNGFICQVQKNSTSYVLELHCSANMRPSFIEYQCLHLRFDRSVREQIILRNVKSFYMQPLFISL
jgi:hypothetical protein